MRITEKNYFIERFKKLLNVVLADIKAKHGEEIQHIRASIKRDMLKRAPKEQAELYFKIVALNQELKDLERQRDSMRKELGDMLNSSYYGAINAYEKLYAPYEKVESGMLQAIKNKDWGAKYNKVLKAIDTMEDAVMMVGVGKGLSKVFASIASEFADTIPEMQMFADGFTENE